MTSDLTPWRDFATLPTPVPCSRIGALSGFDDFDLSHFRLKFSTSAPFPTPLKHDVLNRRPGGLGEYFGMTEGGEGAILIGRRRPDKLHTVGRPAEGHDIRVIDDAD